jgi:hypothetical protein
MKRTKKESGTETVDSSTTPNNNPTPLEVLSRFTIAKDEELPKLVWNLIDEVRYRICSYLRTCRMMFIPLCGFINSTYSKLVMFLCLDIHYHISSPSYLFMFLFMISLITPQYHSCAYFFCHFTRLIFMSFHQSINTSINIFLGGLGRVLPSPVQTRVRACDQKSVESNR